MSNVVNLNQVREDRQREIDDHIEMVIDSTRNYIRGTAKASPVLSDIEVMRGIWMGLSIELFPQHYRDGNPQAEEVVMQVFDDIIDLVESTNEKRREEGES